MKIKNQGIATAFLAAAFAFFCAISTALGNDQENTNAVKVNTSAFEYAKELIKQAAQSRAGQHKYYEVENAAAQLKAMIAMTMEAHAQRWIHRFRLPLISMSRPSRKHQ